MNPPTPSQRIWLITAAMVASAVAVMTIADFGVVETRVELPWVVLVGAFLLTDVLVIHLPTRRSAHTVSVSEFPLVIGLAFVAPLVFVAARMLGTVIGYIFRRQSPMKLSFNTSLLLLETIAATATYHAILGNNEAVSAVGWIASLAAVAVSGTLSVSLVSLAIATHDREASIGERRTDLIAGFLISMFAGVLAILSVIIIWHEPGAAILLAIALSMVFVALRVYERLARRHDELGMAYALTKELEGRHTSRAVSEAGLERVVETLKPSAALVITADGELVCFFEEEDRSTTLDLHWEETLRYHRDVCLDGGDCACARRILGGEWGEARSYLLIVAENVRGMLIVRRRVGRGTEISDSDHRMLEAIAAQLSSAMTRIEAVSQLKREIEEKQALVRSKDRLIASVSHELRTPLTGIIGFASLLAEGGDALDASELEHAKQYIVTEAHDLGNIVEDLLTAARADLGSLEVQAKPVSTAVVIERALLHLHTNDKIDVTGPDCWLSADAARVRQVLRNLLTNALKYGGDRVEISSEPADGVVVIRVVDDGEGVPEDRVGSIFEPYESAHDEPSQPGSLGLGLSISRTLARLMGGDLSYHRIADHTEFRLTLPALKQSSQSEELVG